MTPAIYGIKNCDTMKKARAQLDGGPCADRGAARPEYSKAAVNTGIFVAGGAARSHDGAASFVIPNASLP
jgi:hypothetical protein